MATETEAKAMDSEAQSAGDVGLSSGATARYPSGGMLIINADDWGRDAQTTAKIFDCVRAGSVSAVSAMVFMEDSEKSAPLAREHGIDAGLHLNLTAQFSASNCSPQLLEHHRKIRARLSKHRWARLLLHPGLAPSFQYVVAAQLNEFRRLYGESPSRIDGHHHMHLCPNVIRAGLLPKGTIARRNFSFQPGEKSFLNRFYRNSVDRRLAQRHHLVDFLFNLSPIEPLSRLQRILSLAAESAVEVETHPVNTDEFEFLTDGKFLRLTEGVRIASFRELAVPRKSTQN